MDVERLKAAAKAAYPELWPEEGGAKPAFMDRAKLAFHRQGAMDIIGRAIEAYENYEGDEIKPLADVAIGLPEDAAMIQQVLITICYLDNEGRTSYVVRTQGDGLRTSWLGMCVLTQDYLLKLPGVHQDDD